jgi:hypothetical protein
MPSEIRERPPQPTPHPDTPRQPGSPPGGKERPREDSETAPDFEHDESVYDSYFDDLDVQLSKAAPEPDPALAADLTAAAKRPPSAKDPSIELFLNPTPNQPGTAEFFRGVGSRSDEISPPRVGAGARMLARFTGLFARSRSSSASSSDDEDAEPEARGAWMSLLLLSYASAVTLGLVWMLWTGRAFHSAAPSATSGSTHADDPASKTTEPAIREELPPIPSENLATIGQSIRLGQVEITPLSVQIAAVDLVSPVDPEAFHHDEANSLVLRFKLTNLSNEHAIKPLARSLVRDQSSALDRSFVSTPGGGKIDAYPLAVESEWGILGQEFPVLKPGESGETLVASAPVNEDRIPDQMTWRIRLRIGPYRSDMLAVRFSKAELSQ